VVFCLVPAFFIAGAISNFISQAAVMKYFGAKANKILAYSVASVSGTILAVCSCTVLPSLPVSASAAPVSGRHLPSFIQAGYHVLAIILTARVLGLELGIARAIGAVAFSVIIGLLMHLIFRKEEQAKQNTPDMVLLKKPRQSFIIKEHPVFRMMCGILVFANWSKDDPSVLAIHLFHQMAYLQAHC